jgi:undecaprenyl diphosphate synthase
MYKVSILISGRVQGVGFRVFVEKTAKELGLTGFVENMDTGEVYTEAHGEKQRLQKFILKVSDGPSLSKVEKVFFEWGSYDEKIKEFELKRNQSGMIKDQVSAFLNLAKKTFLSLHSQDSKNSLPIEKFPKHLVIIPDGNRRWARLRNLPTLNGHRVGIVDRFYEIVNYFADSPMEVLTLWCFSTENWNREKEEVEYLMKLFIEVVGNFEKKFLESKINFRHLGRKDRLPKEVLEKISDLEEKTKNFTRKTICLALDYGGRDEIIRAIKKIGNKDNLNAENFGDYLDTKSLPDPDYIVRTSGEFRLSGMLPWQSTYSEFYFTEKHFPDFGVNELNKALYEFQDRKRRFGK